MEHPLPTDEEVQAQRRLVEASPRDPKAWRRLARLLRQRGHLRQALRASLQVVDLAPEDAFTWHSLAHGYRRLDRNHDAEVAHRKAIALEPTFHSAHAYLGEILLEEGRVAEALECFLAAEALAPGSDWRRPTLLDRARDELGLPPPEEDPGPGDHSGPRGPPAQDGA